MAAWEELDNEGEDEEANLALMASTFSDSEFEVGSNSKSEDTNHAIFKLSISDLDTLCHDFMEKCQQKARHVKMITKQYDLLKDEM